MKVGINALTATFVIGVIAGLALTPDGRAWMRHPTLLLGGQASASAPPSAEAETETTAAPVVAPGAPAPTVARTTPRAERLAKGAVRLGGLGD